jgi:putative membrane protein
MKRIGTTGVALALMLAPALARAEEKSTTQTTSKDAARTAGNPMNTPDTDKSTAASSTSASSSDQKEKMTDARLITILQKVNKEEIDAGKLAQKNGQSADIKNFGKKLVADHTKSQTEVAAAAKKAGISQSDSALTSHDREMMKVDKNKMDQLKKLTGNEFDKGFATVMSNDHKHMVSMLKDGKSDLKSEDLKTLVDNTLPVLQQHQDMADDAASKVNRASAGSNQGRAPSSLDRSSGASSSPDSSSKSKTGDDSARSGAQNPDKR